METIVLKKHLPIVFLLVAFILSGCARMRPMPTEGPLASLKRQTIKVEGVKYIPAVSLSKAYQLRWQWDTISYRLVLKKDEHSVVLKPDTRLVIIDGSSLSIKEPPIIHEGSLLIPLSLVEKRLDALFYKRYEIIKKKAVHRIETIVIDPGHGGEDPGAIGIGGLREKDVVLDIAKRLKHNLESNGIKNVILTRHSNIFIPLWQRANIANKKRADFFISIHANSSRSRRARGFEVYYLSEACDDSARAVQAAENAALNLEADSLGESSSDLKSTLWDMINTENRIESIELAQSLCASLRKSVTSRNRGVKSALFYVLKKTRVPAVLVEVGFVSNRSEAAKLRTASYRQRIADALAKGILNYKRRYESTDGFTN